MATASTQLAARLIERFTQRAPMRIGSLIVTLFGDAIVPRGGEVWLGSIIEVLAELGISHRRVRTAVFRLVQDDILINRQYGRRSFYTLTRNGQRQFNEATTRIYTAQDPDWDQGWCLVLTGGLDAATRGTVRKDLRWLGFGQFGGEVLAHPRPERDRLRNHLDALGCGDDLLVFDATLPASAGKTGLQQMVARAWDLHQLDTAYADYLQHFRPMLQRIRKQPAISPADAFFIRTFMIHEFRRAILRDPGLPQALLPPAWKGHDAYELTRAIYNLVVPPSERFINQHFEDVSGGPLPATGPEFEQRFGGLHARCD